MATNSLQGSFPERWQKLKTRWPERAEMAAQMLEGARSVADIGCGIGSLRHALPEHVEYVGLDIVARDPNTIVVDLNRDDIPELDVDAVAMLGVIEYVDQPKRILAQLPRFQKVVITYNHFSLGDIAAKVGLKKRRVGWRHRLTARRFERLLEESGLRVVAAERIRRGEKMYVCVPQAAA